MVHKLNTGVLKLQRNTSAFYSRTQDALQMLQQKQIYIYICAHTRVHTHTHTYIYIYIYISYMHIIQSPFFLSMSISFLYMFRSTMCPSSGEITVCTRRLVLITLCGMNSILHTRQSSVQSDKYQVSHRHSYFS